MLVVNMLQNVTPAHVMPYIVNKINTLYETSPVLSYNYQYNQHVTCENISCILA